MARKRLGPVAKVLGQEDRQRRWLLATNRDRFPKRQRALVLARLRYLLTIWP